MKVCKYERQRERARGRKGEREKEREFGILRLSIGYNSVKSCGY